MADVKSVSAKVVLGPNTRFMYLHAFEPRSINGDNPRYSVCLAISKSDAETVKAVRAGIRAAYQDGAVKLRGNGKSVPPLESIRTPLRDGDVERPDDPAFAGMWFMNANSDRAPGVVDRKKHFLCLNN